MCLIEYRSSSSSAREKFVIMSWLLAGGRGAYRVIDEINNSAVYAATGSSRL